jgi:DNA-binding IclR family transcriptional regulator
LRYVVAVPPAADEPPEEPLGHRTIDRVTQLLEEIALRPGIELGSLTRALRAPKSSVHALLRGLLVRGWVHESDGRYALGPMVYGLTLASGRIRAGQVGQADLDALREDTGMTVLLGVESGDFVIYVGSSGPGALTGYAREAKLRRRLISTAGGKALLAARYGPARDAYLRNLPSADAEAVSVFLSEFAEIERTRIARTYRPESSRLALASVVHGASGESVAAAIIVGRASDVEPREAQVRRTLLRHVEAWAKRELDPREPV